MIRDLFFLRAMVLGVALFALIGAFAPTPYSVVTNPSYAGIPSFCAFVLVLLLFVPEVRVVLRSPSLRVVMACHLFVAALLAWLGAPRSLDALSVPATGSGTVVIASLLAIAVWPFLATWATLVVQRVAMGDDRKGLLAACFAAAPSRWARAFGAMAVVYVVASVIVAVFAFVFARPSASQPVLCAAFVGLTLPWNLMTTTVLLDAVCSNRPFRQVMRSMTSRARVVRRACFALVLVQTLLVGTVVLMPMHTSLKFVWLGGYTDDAHWYSVACEQANVAPSPLLSILLTAASLVLSIAIKLRIAKALQHAPEPAPDSESWAPAEQEF